MIQMKGVNADLEAVINKLSCCSCLSCMKTTLFSGGRRNENDWRRVLINDLLSPDISGSTERSTALIYRTSSHHSLSFDITKYCDSSPVYSGMYKHGQESCDLSGEIILMRVSKLTANTEHLHFCCSTIL